MDNWAEVTSSSLSALFLLFKELIKIMIEEGVKIIKASKSFEGIPHVIEAKDGKLYQLGHFDSDGKYRK